MSSNHPHLTHISLEKSLALFKVFVSSPSLSNSFSKRSGLSDPSFPESLNIAKTFASVDTATFTPFFNSKLSSFSLRYPLKYFIIISKSRDATLSGRLNSFVNFLVIPSPGVTSSLGSNVIASAISSSANSSNVGVFAGNVFNSAGVV